jgi:predicted nucleic acid-binding protein
MFLYLDSCIVIYYVERHPQFFARIDQRISDANTRIVISDLTRMECRVQPLRTGDTRLLERFEHFFRAPDIHCAACTRAVFDRATDLRVRHGLKTPDALHLSAAIEGGCDEFWTTDERLDKAAREYLRVMAF